MNRKKIILTWHIAQMHVLLGLGRSCMHFYVQSNMFKTIFSGFKWIEKHST